MSEINNEEKSKAGQGMGIAGLVLGIVAVISSFIPCFSFWAIITGVLAIIFGAVGLNQAGKNNGKKALPKAGLILGIIATVFAILWWFLFAGAVAASSSELLEVARELEEIKKMK